MEENKNMVLAGAIVVAGLMVATAIVFSVSKAPSFSWSQDGSKTAQVTAFEKCLKDGTHKGKVQASYQDGMAAGVRGTPTAYINGRMVQAQSMEDYNNVIEQELGNQEMPAEVERASINIEGAPVLGSASAPVTFVEFSDFQCPYCKSFRDFVVNTLKETYIKSGQVKFVFKDFPLNQIHPYAQKAAEAAYCAGDQGKYWEYNDYLFDNQTSFSNDAFVDFAQDLGLK